MCLSHRSCSPGCSTPIQRCAGRSNATSPARPTTSGARPGRALPPRDSGPASSRGRTPTGSGREAPSSRPATRAARKASPGPRPPGRSAACATGVSTPPRWPAPPRSLPRTAGGSTTTCPTGVARSTAASTAGRSRTGCGWAPTSTASPSGSWTTASPTAAGTASGWRARHAPRSTPRSTPSRASCYYETATRAAAGARADLRATRRAGEEYLLERRLLHRLSTGEPVGPWAHPVRVPVPLGLQRPQRA